MSISRNTIKRISTGTNKQINNCSPDQPCLLEFIECTQVNGNGTSFTINIPDSIKNNVIAVFSGLLNVISANYPVIQILSICILLIFEGIYDKFEFYPISYNYKRKRLVAYTDEEKLWFRKLSIFFKSKQHYPMRWNVVRYAFWMAADIFFTPYIPYLAISRHWNIG